MPKPANSARQCRGAPKAAAWPPRSSLLVALETLPVLCQPGKLPAKALRLLVMDVCCWQEIKPVICTLIWRLRPSYPRNPETLQTSKPVYLGCNRLARRGELASRPGEREPWQLGHDFVACGGKPIFTLYHIRELSQEVGRFHVSLSFAFPESQDLRRVHDRIRLAMVFALTAPDLHSEAASWSPTMSLFVCVWVCLILCVPGLQSWLLGKCAPASGW